ncbi:ADP-ribosyltransferase-containing protein [Paucibacter soli]|uniref:ADP-ribosyltransferase-containing protein n=1 Tax=Paucibacter soli TaxID=3133433 RepID=UPI0030A8941C
MKSPSPGSARVPPWSDTRKTSNGRTCAENFDAWFAGSCVVDAAGVPLTIFHGTNQPIVSFDEERLGSSTYSTSSKLGFWFSDSEIVAEDYANKAARIVISEVEKHERRTAQLLRDMAEAERRRDHARVDELTHELEAHDIPPTREGAVGQNVVPVYLVIRSPLIVDVKGAAHCTGEGSKVIKQALAAGHDGVIFLNTADTESMTVANHYVVFKPQQIKSAISNSGLFGPDSPDISDSDPSPGLDAQLSRSKDQSRPRMRA